MRACVRDFALWYNTEHRHSRIRFVTPGLRHKGEDQQILAERTELYAKAKVRNPSRWSGETRNWNKIGSVELKPDIRKEAA